MVPEELLVVPVKMWDVIELYSITPQIHLTGLQGIQGIQGIQGVTPATPWTAQRLQWVGRVAVLDGVHQAN